MIINDGVKQNEIERKLLKNSNPDALITDHLFAAR
jgi:mannose/fructose/N-acetylgalactosamine-specific phosphotransferase system component IIB